MLLAELTGVQLFGISQEEVTNLSTTLAKVIAARGGLPKVEPRLVKYGPLTNFVLVLATIYGPRLVMLWKMWEQERATKKRGLTIVPARESSAATDFNPDKAVN